MMSELSSLVCVYIPIQPHTLRWFDGSLLCFSMYCVGNGNLTKSCIPTGLVNLLVDYIKVTDNIFPIHIAQWIIVKDDFLLFYSCRSTKLSKIREEFQNDLKSYGYCVFIYQFLCMFFTFFHISFPKMFKKGFKVSEMENWFIYLSNKIQFWCTLFASLMRLQTETGENIACVMSSWKNVLFKLFTFIQYMKQTWILIFFLRFSIFEVLLLWFGANYYFFSLTLM